MAISEVLCTAQDIQRMMNSKTQRAQLPSGHLTRAFGALSDQLSNLDNVAASGIEFQHIFDQLAYYIQRDTANPWLSGFMLRATGALLYQRAPVFDQKAIYSLLDGSGVLARLCQERKPGWERVQLATVQCVRNICLKLSPIYNQPKTAISSEVASACFHLLVSAIQNSDYSSQDITHPLKIAFCGFVGLQSLLENNHKLDAVDLNKFLGLLKAFIGCGLPGSVISLPFSLNPLVSADVISTSDHSSLFVSLPSSSHKSVIKRRKAKPPKRERERMKAQNGSAANGEGSSLATSTSASEDTDSCETANGTEEPADITNGVSALSLKQQSAVSPVKARPDRYVSGSGSDSDRGNCNDRENLQNLKQGIRSAVLATLVHVTKATLKKNLFGYWFSFVPDAEPLYSSKSNYDLMTVVLRDRNTKTRAAALIALSEWISTCRQFLVLAEKGQRKVASFTSLAVLLASSINELFRNLLLALSAEKCPSVLTQILKCIANLGCNCNLKKVVGDQIFKIVTAITPYLFMKGETNVRTASLTCFSVLVTSEMPTKDVVRVLNPEICEQQQFSMTSVVVPAEAKQSCGIWLIDTCCDFVTDTVTNPTPVRLEAMQTLARLVKVHFDAVCPVFNHLLDFVIRCLADPIVRLHAVKIIIQLLYALNRHGATIDSTTSSSDISLNAINAWTTILSTDDFVVCFTCRDDVPLIAAACETLSCLVADTYSGLPSNLQDKCKSFLSSLYSERDPLVRTAVLRTVGTLISLPSFNKDFKFLLDSFSLINSALTSSNSSVLEKLSFCVSMYSDVLFKLELPDIDIQSSDDLTVSQVKLAKVALAGCMANKNQVKPGCVLALGKFLKKLVYRSNTSCCHKLISDALKCIMECLTTATNKAKFNACAAAGLSFSNDFLFHMFDHQLMQLLQVVTLQIEGENATVGVLAAKAIGHLLRRPADFEFRVLLKTLLKGLEMGTASNGDFSAYKNRESLVSSCFETFVKLLRFANRADLAELLPSTEVHQKAFVGCCEQFKSTQLLTDNNNPIKISSKNGINAKSVLLQHESVVADDFFECINHLQLLCYSTSSIVERNEDATLCADLLLSVMCEGFEGV